MPSTMMGLGDFRFSIDTAAYQSFRRRLTVRQEEIPRSGREPKIQHTGRSAERITMSGVIYPTYSGGIDQVPLMREIAKDGKPLMMVAGTGDILGLWSITSVEETQKVFFKDGVPKKVNFSISLVEYGED